MVNISAGEKVNPQGSRGPEKENTDSVYRDCGYLMVFYLFSGRNYLKIEHLKAPILLRGSKFVVGNSGSRRPAMLSCGPPCCCSQMLAGAPSICSGTQNDSQGSQLRWSPRARAQGLSVWPGLLTAWLLGPGRRVPCAAPT